MLVTGFHRVKQIDYRYNWEPEGAGGGGAEDSGRLRCRTKGWVNGSREVKDVDLETDL